MRLYPTVAVALALVIGAGAAVAAAKAHHKHGRVVRVERAPPGRTEVPRLCQPMQADGSSSCWGQSVKVGEVANVYDDTGRRAIVRVTGVTPQKDNCGDEISWNITSTAIAGSLDQITYSSFAVFDWNEGAEHGRAIVNNGQIPAPQQLPGESVMAAFDTDGDDTAELIITSYTCDTSGQAVTSGSPGAYCMVYYVRDGASYRPLRTDVVKNCY